MILPPFVAERLRLNEDQRRRLDALQREVDDELARILTAEQKEQLEQMRPRGPMGPDGPPRPRDGDRPPPR